jgi:23S rRNA U2552 (ribose-2'-O)-methylase RlmE/FtsJ
MEPPKPPLIKTVRYDAFTGSSSLAPISKDMGFSSLLVSSPPPIASNIVQEAPKTLSVQVAKKEKDDWIHLPARQVNFMYKNPDVEEGKSASAPAPFIDQIKMEWKEKKQSLFFRKYYEEISREKEEIDKLNNNEIWDKMKKIGNPFELIFTTYHRKRKNDSISKYIPLSRSYFKMWEIYHNFPIFQYFPLNTKFRLAHLAEGPGGFMEASYNYLQHIRTSHYHKTQLKQMMNKDVYHGITLKPHNDYVPDWNKIKKIFGPENNVHVHYGNLYIYEDVINYVSLFKEPEERAHIVTADGGFDYSADFNGQELNSCQIVFSEMVIALKVLAKHGTFICKVFDLFSIPMMKMLEILKQNFEYLYIYKPETSRPANSEKYIVCMNYLDRMKEEEKDHLIKCIEIWNEMVKKPVLPPPPIPSGAKKDLDPMIHRLEEQSDSELSCACCGNKKKDLDRIFQIKGLKEKNLPANLVTEETSPPPPPPPLPTPLTDEQIRQDYYIDFAGIKVSNELIYLLNDYNNKYMEGQKKSLQKTLQIAKKNPTSIIEKEDYDMLIKQQVKNAHNWCTKYNVPINEESIYWQKYK